MVGLGVSQDPGRILYACGEDMVTLWNDPLIKSLLRSQGTRLEDMPGLCVVRCGCRLRIVLMSV